MTRRRLPDRRPCITVETTHAGLPVTVTIGIDPETGEAGEVFADGPKYGSDMQHTLADTCVMASISLQHGIGTGTLGHSLGTVPVWGEDGEAEAPASPLGLIVDTVARLPEHIEWIEKRRRG